MWWAHATITQSGTGKNGCGSKGNGGCNGNGDINQLKAEKAAAAALMTTAMATETATRRICTTCNTHNKNKRHQVCCKFHAQSMEHA
jgi:hypothetical protein